jgi:hypothetical protein
LLLVPALQSRLAAKPKCTTAATLLPVTIELKFGLGYANLERAEI